MDDVEYDGDEKHQSTIKNIKEDLVPLDEAVVAVEIFDNSENRTNDDEGACEIECIEKCFPLHEKLSSKPFGLLSRLFDNSPMENYRNHDEKSEEEELDD
jgi:hypothetical protein